MQAVRLRRAKDLLIEKVPSKLPEYFPLLLEFRATPDAGEKEMIVSIVMDCITAVPEFGCVTASIGFVRQMLNDAFARVVMAALLATRKLICISIHTLCSPEHPVERKRLMWDALKGVIENVIGFDLTAHQSDGIRMLTFKLIEQLALIMSDTHSPATPGPLLFKDIIQYTLECNLIYVLWCHCCSERSFTIHPSCPCDQYPYHLLC
jgi:hypothetical protein